MSNNFIDQQQRHQALHPAQSFIVQAPAGSGKTELLIQRFLTLLTVVKMPEEILAITFTKKAANEMRLRIIAALKQAATNIPPNSEHNRQTFELAKQVLKRDAQLQWRLIDNPNQLRIQTIDSLCAYLTRQLPILSHFGAQPQIATYPIFLYQEAVTEVLMHVEENYEWSAAIGKILTHVDNDFNKLSELLVNLLAKRDQWLPYLQLSADPAIIRRRLENDLAKVITNHLTHLCNHFPMTLANEMMAIARFAADQLILDNKNSPLLACRNLMQLPGPRAQDQQAWLGLASLLLTKKFEWRKKVDAEIGFPALNSITTEKQLHIEYRQKFAELITQLSVHEELQTALTELFFLPPPYYHDAQWEVLQALLQVLKIVTAQLRVVFQQHGQIDFIENALAALTALGSDEQPTHLALALDYQIRHILVDEFQDTAYTQYQLLEKLLTGWEQSDGRTLFVVGDPMQSIYRFREAEVGLFIRMVKEGIANMPLTPLALSVNFRSDTTIVEWNNHHFRSLFPSFNDVAKGAVTYSPSAASRASIDNAAAITINGLINSDDSAQAQRIVSLLQDIKNKHPQDNIAILVRSRTHLAQLMPALKQAKLAYHAVDIDPLAERQGIQDVLSLTRALLHPADRIAWLSILRAPWCGLTLADLFAIAGGSPYKTIWEQLNHAAIIQTLTDDGQQRVNKFNAIINKQMLHRDRYPLRYWIENTWLLLGGPACLQDEADIEDMAVFFKLLEECDQSADVLNIQTLQEKITQLFAKPQHNESSISIMTIHSAKGLEFDTVILPHLERNMPHDQKSLLQWMEYPLMHDQMALLLAPIHSSGVKGDVLYEYIRRQQKIKSDYETDRLLYVATTRAKKRLCLLFNVDKQTDDKITIRPGSFLEKLWPFFKNNQQFFIEAQVAEPLISHQTISKPIRRLVTQWQNPYVEMLTDVAVHQKQDGFHLVKNTAMLMGTVVHHLLQYIAELSFAWWSNKNNEQQTAYVTMRLAQLGMSDSDMKQAMPMVFKAINNTLADARGRWILSPHQHAQSELGLTACLDGEPENFILDRTFVDEAGTRWIIDYKTTTFSKQDLAQFLQKEQAKYLEKMQKYARAMQLTENRPIRLALYFPMLPAWQVLS